MRKEYRHALKRAVADEVAKLAPDFVHQPRLVAPTLSGKDIVYQWVVCDALTVFLVITSAEGRQAFTVELAWSGTTSFPEVTMRPDVVLTPADPDPVDVPEGVVRLGGLRDRRDLWWDLPDPPVENPGDLQALAWAVEPLDPREAREAVMPCVQEAVDVFMEFGMAFIRSLRAARCSG